MKETCLAVRLRISVLCGLMASVLVAVTFSSCHARMLTNITLHTTERVDGTTTAHLERDYRSMRWNLPVWCPPLATSAFGDVATEVDAALGSKFVELANRVWIVAPGPNWAWLIPMALWLSLLHVIGAVSAVAHARWHARRGAFRRGGSSARDHASVPAMLMAGAVYLVVAPIAAGVLWLLTFDIWWPGILESREAFPSLLGAAGSVALCLIPALLAGWVTARVAVPWRVRQEPALRGRRCARCGYDPGRETVDRCPECGALPGRWCGLRRVVAMLVSGPSRLALYIILIGGTITWMYIWAFGPPGLPEPNATFRPKYTLAFDWLQDLDAHIVWRDGPEPTLIRWPDGWLLFAERIEERGAGATVRATYAAAWLPRGLDAEDSSNWRFQTGGDDATDSIRVKVQEGEKWRLFRVYGRGRAMPYIDGDNVSEAYVAGRPIAIEKVGPSHRLAGIGDILLGKIDNFDDADRPPESSIP